MSHALYFVVPGPAVGKGRPRVTARGGKPRLFTPAKTVAWEQRVAAAAIDALGGGHLKPSSYPWSVEIREFRQIPASWPKTRRERVNTGLEFPGRPDTDNVGKAVLDACNGIVYVDDSQVIDCFLSKRYSSDPRVEVYAHEVRA